MYKCLHGSAPAYLIDELCQVADVEARQRLRSSSSSSLIVSRTRLSTVGDRAFPVAAARVWNSLPQLVTSVPSVAVFRGPSSKPTCLTVLTLQTCDCTVPAQWRLVAFGHYNRSSLLTYITMGPVTTWMGDSSWARKPSGYYITSHLGRLSLLPSVGW